MTEFENTIFSFASILDVVHGYMFGGIVKLALKEFSVWFSIAD